MTLDKFLAPFINFVDKNIGRGEHKYIFITSEKYIYGLTKEHNVEFLHTDDDIFITLLKYMTKSKKIVLHGLWRDKINILLYFNKKLLKKCYWIMWGGDFYFPEKQSIIKHNIIRYMGYLVTGNIEEFNLVKKTYKAEGCFIKCFTYPSNTIHSLIINQRKRTKTIKILLNHSADSTGNHIEIINKLSKYSQDDILVYAPLSYSGTKDYIEQVINHGKKVLSNKFIPLTTFIPYNKYIEFLSSIDIALFNHNRQQAAGNIYNLLSFGIKVHIQKNTTVNKYMEEIGLQVYDINNFDLFLLEDKIKYQNIKISKYYFSKDTLLKSLKEWIC